MSDLAELQRWFAQALVSRELDYTCLAERVADDSRLTGEQRMYIYAQGYQLRLLECMRAEFECLASVMGSTLFDQFALMYLAQRPSRCWTLFNLGEDFARFLETMRPDNPDVSLKLPEQLAELEHRVACAIRASGSERCEMPVIDPVSLLLGRDIELALANTASVMVSDFDLAVLFDNISTSCAGSPVQLGQTYILISRCGYRVKVVKLNAWQYSFLNDPVWQQGSASVQAVWCQRAPEVDVLQLSGWLIELCNAGVLTRMRDKPRTFSAGKDSAGGESLL